MIAILHQLEIILPSTKLKCTQLYSITYCACGLTGPKPPPLVAYSGCFFKSNSSTCCRGVWLVDSLHGSDSTYTQTKDKDYFNPCTVFGDNILCIIFVLETTYHQQSKLPVYRQFMAMGSHLFKEGWVNPQVLGHHIEAEKMAINAFASHGHSIEVLVLFCCQLQKSQLLLSLNEEFENKNDFFFIQTEYQPLYNLSLSLTFTTV